MHNAMFKAFGSRKSLTLYVGVKSKMQTSLFQLLLLYAETEEERDRLQSNHNNSRALKGRTNTQKSLTGHILLHNSLDAKIV